MSPSSASWRASDWYPLAEAWGRSRGMLGQPVPDPEPIQAQARPTVGASINDCALLRSRNAGFSDEHGTNMERAMGTNAEPGAVSP